MASTPWPAVGRRQAERGGLQGSSGHSDFAPVLRGDLHRVLGVADVEALNFFSSFDRCLRESLRGLDHAAVQKNSGHPATEQRGSFLLTPLLPMAL